MEIKFCKAFSTESLEQKDVLNDACAQEVNEASKTIFIGRKITLVDEKLCVKDGKRCDALRKYPRGDGFTCAILKENLYWRIKPLEIGAMVEYLPEDLEVIRCDECLRQERENGNEQL